MSPAVEIDVQNPEGERKGCGKMWEMEQELTGVGGVHEAGQWFGALQRKFLIYIIYLLKGDID
jgi:hypothetical protein